MTDNPHQTDEGRTHSRIILREPTACPFPDELLTRRFGFDGIPLTPDEIDRCLKARRSLPIGVLEQLTVTCLRGPETLPPGMTPAYPFARYHAETQVSGRCVHIEGIAQQLGGPGGTNKEVRVYVDGVLEGRSILLGRLGGNVNTYPVVALIDTETAMRVTPVQWLSLRELRIELLQCGSEEDSSGAAGGGG